MEQLVIEPVEIGDAFLLMGEDFDHLLTVHHLFNVAVDGGNVFLLRDKVAGA